MLYGKLYTWRSSCRIASSSCRKHECANIHFVQTDCTDWVCRIESTINLVAIVVETKRLAVAMASGYVLLTHVWALTFEHVSMLWPFHQSRVSAQLIYDPPELHVCVSHGGGSIIIIVNVIMIYALYILCTNESKRTCSEHIGTMLIWYYKSLSCIDMRMAWVGLCILMHFKFNFPYFGSMRVEECIMYSLCLGNGLADLWVFCTGIICRITCVSNLRFIMKRLTRMPANKYSVPVTYDRNIRYGA